MGVGLGKFNQITDELRARVESQSVTAGTLEELAEKMNVPVDKFKSTIARYNQLARSGKDLDFGKRSDRMTTIEKPPFYAGKGFYWFMCAMGGLIANTRLQPLDKNFEVIQGLYLGGNIIGNRFGVRYPSMLPGLSNGMALHFGRIAGINAVI
jgi:fumarate reductase flavoprotein subunit